MLASQVAALRPGQQYNFNQSQRAPVPSSLPVARAQVSAARTSLVATPSTPTTLPSSATAQTSEATFGTPGYSGEKVGNVLFGFRNLSFSFRVTINKHGSGVLLVK